MNNYCRNCGKKITDNVKECPNCGVEIFYERVNVEEKKAEIEKLKKKENVFIITILSLFGLSFLDQIIDNEIIRSICPIFSATAALALIYARVTLNESKKIRILFIILISIIGIYLVFLLVLLMTCNNFINRGCR